MSFRDGSYRTAGPWRPTRRKRRKQLLRNLWAILQGFLYAAAVVCVVSVVALFLASMF